MLEIFNEQQQITKTPIKRVRDLSWELLLLLQVEEIEFLYSSKDLKKIICAYDNTALKYFLIILKFK